MASVQPVPDQWVLAEPGATAVPLDRYWTMLGDPLVERLVGDAGGEEDLDLGSLLEELGLPYEIKHYQRDPQTMLAPPCCEDEAPALVRER